MEKITIELNTLPLKPFLPNTSSDMEQGRTRLIQSLFQFSAPVGPDTQAHHSMHIAPGEQLWAHEIEQILSSKSTDDVKILITSLAPLFNAANGGVHNQTRFGIINVLLSHSSDQWSELLEQAGFLLTAKFHHGTLHHVIATLCECQNPEFRKLLVEATKHLVNYEMTSQQIGWLLKKLSKLDTEALENVLDMRRAAIPAYVELMQDHPGQI